MAVFDATALLHFLEPDAKAPLDPATDATQDQANDTGGVRPVQLRDT